MNLSILSVIGTSQSIVLPEVKQLAVSKLPFANLVAPLDGGGIIALSAIVFAISIGLAIHMHQSLSAKISWVIAPIPLIAAFLFVANLSMELFLEAHILSATTSNELFVTFYFGHAIGGLLAIAIPIVFFVSYKFRRRSTR